MKRILKTKSREMRPIICSQLSCLATVTLQWINLKVCAKAILRLTNVVSKYANNCEEELAFASGCRASMFCLLPEHITMATRETHIRVSNKSCN